ncbi:hypothetical protein BD410DRAFT_780369 [Rickenella mellea]|uniref:Uncharacterized protein n=1 Tax=Rickenella mellea TaxID=50990 RepID=A0A4R5XHE9_9AGAM|nr:hypothetical protein BD410DRAFT_780369 [Rickenella mellea]
MSTSRGPRLKTQGPDQARISVTYPRAEGGYYNDFFCRYWLWVAFHALAIHTYTTRVGRGWTADDTARLLWDVLPIHRTLKDSHMSYRLREYVENDLYSASPFFNSGEATPTGQLV